MRIPGLTLSAGRRVREKDLGIMCPYDHHADVNEYGSCHCALCASEKIGPGQNGVEPVPVPQSNLPIEGTPSAYLFGTYQTVPRKGDVGNATRTNQT